jgi:hypothetical protein
MDAMTVMDEAKTTTGDIRTAGQANTIRRVGISIAGVVNEVFGVGFGWAWLRQGTASYGIERYGVA